LNNIYQDENIWLTYGQYRSISDNKIGCCRPIKDTSIYREQSWCTSHLKTFKYGLWKHLNINDFIFDGYYVDSPAWDHVILFPLLEMATTKHIKCIETEILYDYNNLNDICEYKKNGSHQVDMANFAKYKMKRYKPLEKL